ncbi:MAG: acyltransferase [Chloroflexi bacterium]|nr:acyltransferase [Chloroflexota bacterium]
MREHVPALDGLRGIAILLVLLVHSRIPPSPDVPSALLQFIQSSGWMGVDLFFVLSGFLITGILLDIDHTVRAALAFYVRRVLRIWPLYFLTVGVGLLVLASLSAFSQVSVAGREWEWLVFVQNLDARPAPGSVGVLWSVGVEEQMYVALLLLVMLLPRRKLACSLIAMVIMAPIFRFAMLENGANISTTIYQSPLARMDTFALGGALAMQSRAQGGLARLGAWPVWIALASGLVIVSLGSALYGFDAWSAPFAVAGYSMVALFMACLLTISITRCSRAFSSAPLRLFGRYSFAIYLFHYPVWTLIGPALWRPSFAGSLWPAQLLADGTMLVISVAGGWVSWTLIERHFLALKKFVPYARANRQETTPSVPMPKTPRVLSPRYRNESGVSTTTAHEAPQGPPRLATEFEAVRTARVR